MQWFIQARLPAGRNVDWARESDGNRAWNLYTANSRRRRGYPSFRLRRRVFVLSSVVSAAVGFIGRLVALWGNGTGQDSRPWLWFVALFPMPWFFLELFTSRFESCSSFADSGFLERPIRCCLLPKSDRHWCYSCWGSFSTHLWGASRSKACLPSRRSAIWGIHWSSICTTWPLHLSKFLMRLLSMPIMFASYNMYNKLTLALLSQSQLMLRAAFEDSVYAGRW